MNVGNPALRRLRTWRPTDNIRPLRRLAREVADDTSSVHLVSSLVHRAIHTGVLVESDDHAYLPAPRHRGASVPELPEIWRSHGFVPFRIKRCTLPPEQIKALGVIFGVLNQHPELHAVPQWISDGWVLSMYLSDAVDLRAADPGDHADARAVHDVCLRSLAMFAERDETLRESLRQADCGEPPRFPVARRYADALTGLAHLLGLGRGLDLPPQLPGRWDDGRWTLFCDPKPANFLIATADRHPLDPRAQTFRIDLDLLYFQCPLALQVVLSLFAHPVVFPAPGPIAEQVSMVRGTAHTASKVMNVDPDEVDAMLLYHLVRNFTTAAGDAAAGKPAARAKAAGMAPVLVAVLRLLPAVDAPRTVDALLAWMDRAAAP